MGAGAVMYVALNRYRASRTVGGDSESTAAESLPDE